MRLDWPIIRSGATTPRLRKPSSIFATRKAFSSATSPSRRPMPSKTGSRKLREALPQFVARTPTFDPQTFGSKVLNRTGLEQLHDGLRRAGLLPAEATPLRIADYAIALAELIGCCSPWQHFL